MLKCTDCRNFACVDKSCTDCKAYSPQNNDTHRYCLCRPFDFIDAEECKYFEMRKSYKLVLHNKITDTRESIRTSTSLQSIKNFGYEYRNKYMTSQEELEIWNRERVINKINAK